MKLNLSPRPCLCGKGTLSYKKKDVVFYYKYLGKLVAKNAYERSCDKCGLKLIPDKTAKIISDQAKKKVEDFLQNSPFKDFWSLRQTYSYLGLTRVEFHKDPRHSHLIWNLLKDGQRFYHSKSVKTFKECGDGRFKI